MIPTSAADRRSHERFDLRVPVVYTQFTSHPSGHQEATVKNCSEGGIYFETGDALLPGQYIRVRLKGAVDAAVPLQARERLRTNAVAQVRWCQKNTHPQPSPYGVGARYC